MFLRITALSCLASLALSVSAQADNRTEVPALLANQEIMFSYQGMNSYYSCDYAESQAKNILAQLGAQNIRVRCNGGLESNSPFVNVTARFSAVHETTTEKATRTATESVVSLKFDESCGFNETATNALLAGFEVYEKNVDSSCFDWQGRLNVSVKTLK